MSAPFDSVLLTGFGGPTPGCCRRHDECPGEAYCYVENVVGGRTGGAGRIREVAAHYARFGGFSPFSHFSQKQAGALETYLAAAGSPMPVYVGFRFWTPYIREALAEMGRRGLRRALGVVLAPHRAKVSWEAYQGSARAAREEVGERELHEVEDRDHVHVEHAIPGVEGRVLDGAESDDSRGVHQDVEPAVVRGSFVDQALPVGLARQIAGERLRLAPRRLYPGHRLREPVLPPRRHRDLRPFAREPFGRSPPDPARRPGYQSHFSLEASVSHA